MFEKPPIMFPEEVVPILPPENIFNVIQRGGDITPVMNQVNRVNNNNITPLLYAISERQSNAVQQLLNAGANTEHRMRDNITLYHLITSFTLGLRLLNVL